MTKFIPKKGYFWSKNKKNKHRILHIRFGLGTKFQPQQF